MNVIFVPVRLKLSAILLLFSVPLVALEVIIASRAPWWKLPYDEIVYWSLIFIAICLPLCLWLVSAKRWAFFLTSLFAVGWIFISLCLGVLLHHPTLEFFTLFLSVFLGGELFWLKLELQRSFLDPQLKWYQGLPKSIAGLKCILVSNEKGLDLSVSRMDSDGAFLFISEKDIKLLPALATFLEERLLNLTFDLQGYRICCKGMPTAIAWEGKGVGIRFCRNSSDQKKEIGDFLEILHGKGYA